MFDGTRATFTKMVITCDWNEIFLLNLGHLFLSSFWGHMKKIAMIGHLVAL